MWMRCWRRRKPYRTRSKNLWRDIYIVATIEQTLQEIPPVRTELHELTNQERVLDRVFLQNLNNWLAVYYIDLLAHGCMNRLPSNVSTGELPSAYQEYIKLTSEPLLYQETIRVSNLAGMAFLWFEFEQLIKRTYESVSGTDARQTFRKMHTIVMRNLGFPDQEVLDNCVKFDGIRETRNSLHNGGRHNKHEHHFELLDGNMYSLLPDQSVTPLRLMVIVQEMLRHYRELEFHSSRRH